ncbi:hypothetical protein CK203_078563 [Vitis vinifera]|uniref:Carbohydrate kinase PfkB domain-containing protein n=1 Tax=Vitis vinifera TaxID=29760 RepID=A0A438FA97_VITVI|nr:hypothetical protein CK203_078563 [Vitis vinifera]
MGSSGVNFSALRIKKGPTTQCVCLVDALGNRTMRSCLSSVVKIQADELTKEDFKRVKWLVMRYGIYNLEVIHAVIQMAKEEGVFVSLDLASFEMVRNIRGPLLKLLDDENASLEVALEFLAKHCQWAVVALGYNRCLAKCGREMVRVPAIRKAKTTDAIGAGDLFAGGFLYGLVKGLSLEECC